MNCAEPCISRSFYLFTNQVTLSKDGSSGDYTLEAGALVLGDQGTSVGTLFNNNNNNINSLFF